ncbi:MAG: ABC transporter substrate-binding protein [Spirochaetales bacterium]|nr:ABC transporter substrate-binding protein [Spirochaetales bacterium]
MRNNFSAMFVFMVFTTVITFFGCTKDEDAQNGSKRTLTDAVGRVVEIPDDIDNGIVTIGSRGPLRFLSIFNIFDKIIEVDKGDVTDKKNGRAYSYAFGYDSFDSSMHHPDNQLESETVEKIGAKNPSLIIVEDPTYKSFQKNCEILAKKFPLIVLPPQSLVEMWDNEYSLASWYCQAVNSIGSAIGQEDRAKNFLAEVNGIIQDIRTLIKASETKVYVAGLTWRGSNELNTTFPTYLPLDLIDGANAHGGDEKTRVEMDPEDVTLLDIDYFVIDPTSVDKLSTPNSQLILKWLYLRNSDNDSSNNIKIFATLPMIWDSANYDCILAGAYYLAHILYGTLTKEEAEQKIEEVFTTYYGENGKKVLPRMKEFFTQKSESHGADLVPLNQLEVFYKNGEYSLRRI